ncbi:nucleoporin [Martiniozyma asiatica (nom. inval.)]|nr:nucleoporin [Martiniozyma asiatica]
MAISLYQSLISTVKVPAGAENFMEKKPVTDLPSLIVEARRVASVVQPYIQPAMKNSSTPYLVLALCQLFFIRRFNYCLLPYFIYSVFHALNYLRTLLPSLNISTEKKENWKNLIGNFIVKYNTKCMQWVVSLELYCLLVFIFRAIWGVLSWNRVKVNLFGAFIWFWFICVRWDESLLVKKIITNLVTYSDGVFADPRVPPIARQYYAHLKQLIIGAKQKVA